MKYILMKLIQMVTAVVILNNIMVCQINPTLKALCLLLFLPLNLHQPVGIKGKLKIPTVNISI